MYRTPWRAASSSIAAASCSFRPMGFSASTCLPARIAVSEIGHNTSCGVATRTASTEASSSSASTDEKLLVQADGLFCQHVLASPNRRQQDRPHHAVPDLADGD